MVKLEKRGSVVVGASFSLAAAGLILVDGVLIAIGLAGAILVGLAKLLGWWNLRRLETTVEAPGVAQAGDEVRLGVVARNRRRLVDAFRVRISVKGAGNFEAEALLPWIAAGSSASGEVRVELPARGVSEALEVELTSEFPWGLFRQSRNFRIGHRMRVLPRPVVPVEMLAGSGSLGSGERRRPGAREAVGELRGLRDYRAGDRVKTVAWAASVKSAAQGGALMVRELDPPGFRPQRVILLFHSYGADRALIRPDRFERALSLGWGAVRRLRMRRVPVTWLADFEEWVPREVVGRDSLSQLGDALCRARRAPGTEAHEVEARLDELDGEVVVISDMPPAAWEGLVAGRRGVRVVDVSDYERGLRLKGGSRA
ncbi:DUF58 domain-containing protein [Haloferula sp. A504]|uniref:DUF58 domain-containing protein n=1 Tax=Haloferula sp. A504 TaxID=3373601 RepID=UPI0037C0FD78